MLKVPYFLLNLDKDFIEKNKNAKGNIYHWGNKKEIIENHLLLDKYDNFLKREYLQLFKNLQSLVQNKDIINNSHSLNHLLYQVIIKDDGKVEDNE